MQITILCDQIDCTFNKTEYDSDRIKYSECTHPHPAIQRYGTGNTDKTHVHVKTICNSKSTKVWDNPHTPSCDNCETPDSNNCINCCHKPK